MSSGTWPTQEFYRRETVLLAIAKTLPRLRHRAFPPHVKPMATSCSVSQEKQNKRLRWQIGEALSILDFKSFLRFDNT
jgi:hypothetical protein